MRPGCKIGFQANFSLNSESKLWLWTVSCETVRLEERLLFRGRPHCLGWHFLICLQAVYILNVFQCFLNKLYSLCIYYCLLSSLFCLSNHIFSLSSPPPSLFLVCSHRWILLLLYGKVFRSVSSVIQHGATTGIVPDPAGATPPNGQMTTPWSLQEQLSTTGTKTTSAVKISLHWAPTT